MPDSFDISVKATMPEVPASERVATVRRIFGLGDETREVILLESTRVPAHGITLIAGPSGAGKSTLLRRISALRPDARCLPEIDEPDTPIVDLFSGEVPELIRWMSLFGLGEARLMTTPYRLLSDGQKARTRLAVLMKGAPGCIVIDEFLATLDRLTARVVAHNLQKVCRREGVDAYLATAHNDLVDALSPDHLITVELGGASRTEPITARSTLAEVDALEFEEGTAEDYRSLARYHYIEHLASEAPLTEIEWAQTVSHVRVARHQGKVVAAAVFSRPVPQLFERIPLFHTMNERIIVVLRVIVHPLFRGVGVTKRLLQPPVTDETRSLVACSALGLYFPFFIGAGFTKVPHPRNLRYAEHDALEALLDGLTPREHFRLNNYAAAQAFYNNRPVERKEEIRRVASAICIRSNVDYCVFTARLARVEEPESVLRAFLTKFFSEIVSQVSDDEFGTLISEALYFPVQGFVRQVFPELENGGASA